MANRKQLPKHPVHVPVMGQGAFLVYHPETLRIPLPDLRPSGEDSSTLWNGRGTFDNALELATRFHIRLANAGATLHPHELSREIARRVSQLDYLLKICHVLSHRLSEVTTNWGKPGGSEAFQYVTFSLELNTEAFYYFAHRLQTILIDNKKHLPDLTKYRPARGIRDIRNHFIEHPPGDDWNGMGWKYGGRGGPAVRTGRKWDGPTPAREPGLFHDAEEFIDRVEEVLTRAHESLDRRGVPPERLSKAKQSG